MDEGKDIRFSQKKVDEAWKDQTGKEKDRLTGSSPRPQSTNSNTSAKGAPPKTSKAFAQLLTSLGYQALMHLGEFPSPETGAREVQIEAAKGVIDLLVDLKAKTEGNLSAEESEILNTLIPELQMKYASRA